MKDKTIRLGLIGKDVSKSLSEEMHRFILAKFGWECEYERFSVGEDEFPQAAETLVAEFDGFNITIPYKRAIMDYVTTIVGDAERYGAVNTVITSSRTGYNTDGVGFALMLDAAKIDAFGKRVLVLGAGGAGRSSAVTLKELGADVYLYQRRKEELAAICARLGVRAAENIEDGGYDILVNCTGVGMHDTEGKSPVGAEAFRGATAAIDLIYVPEKTEFLRLAEGQGLQILGGRAMLFYQAYYADCLYLDRPPLKEVAAAWYEAYEAWKKKGETQCNF